MVAVQGPAAPAALEEAVGILPKRFRTYRGLWGLARSIWPGPGTPANGAEKS